MRQTPVQDRDARLVVLVEERAADQFVCARQPFGAEGHVAFQIVEDLVGAFQASGLQGIVAVSAFGEWIGTVFEQQLCGFQTARRTNRVSE